VPLMSSLTNKYDYPSFVVENQILTDCLIYTKNVNMFRKM
jgi:hypothetical protein